MASWPLAPWAGSTPQSLIFTNRQTGVVTGCFSEGRGDLSWVMTPFTYGKNVLKLLYIDVKLCNDSRNFPFFPTKCTRRCLVYQTYLGAEKSLLDRLKKQLREMRSSSAFLVLCKALSGTISIATFCGMR